MRRRDVLALLAGTAGSLALAPGARAEAPLVLLHGFSEASVTGGIARFVAAVLERQGLPAPQVTSLPGDHGYNGFLGLAHAPADGSTLLIADTLTLMLNAVSRDTVDEVLALVPVAKVTSGMSTALVTGTVTGLADWASFAAAAGTGELRMATSGTLSAYGPAVGWTMAATAPMAEVEAIGNAAILEAVAAGSADAGVAMTNSLPAFIADNPGVIEVVATFGAKRSPHFPEVPTFAELVGDDKRDYTISFSVFASSGTPEEAVAPLGAALAGPYPEDLVAPLAEIGLAIAPADAATAAETVERDLGVARSLLGV